VDDSEPFLAASRAMLERQGVRVVAVAMTAAECLLRARELTPDFVLVDIELGQESGFEVTRQLANTVETAHLAVILISTHPEDDFADLIRESPAIGFVSKLDLSKRAIEEVLNQSDDCR
jgi:two-component system nitrate/nitrite response regulator NarL